MYSSSSQAATSMWSSSGTTSGHGSQQWLCDWNCSTTMKAAAVLLGLLFTSRVLRAVPTASSSQADVPLWVLGSRVPQLLLLVVPSIFPLSIFRFSDRFFLLLLLLLMLPTDGPQVPPQPGAKQSQQQHQQHSSSAMLLLQQLCQLACSTIEIQLRMCTACQSELIVSPPAACGNVGSQQHWQTAVLRPGSGDCASNSVHHELDRGQGVG